MTNKTKINILFDLKKGGPTSMVTTRTTISMASLWSIDPDKNLNCIYFVGSSDKKTPRLSNYQVMGLVSENDLVKGGCKVEDVRKLKIKGTTWVLTFITNPDSSFRRLSILPFSIVKKLIGTPTCFEYKTEFKARAVPIIKKRVDSFLFPLSDRMRVIPHSAGFGGSLNPPSLTPLKR